MPPLLDAHVGDNHDALAGNMVDHEIDCSQACALGKSRLRVRESGNKKNEMESAGWGGVVWSQSVDYGARPTRLNGNEQNAGPSNISLAYTGPSRVPGQRLQN